MEQKRTRRTFDPSFKHHAAQRVVEGKEKAAAVAADLGINIVSLYNCCLLYTSPSPRD